MNYYSPKQTINATYYFSLLQKVYSKLPRVKPGKIHKCPFFLQDNACVHTTKVSMAKLHELKWQLLPHLAYSPDLAPSDFHLFGPLKDPLLGKRFGCESELKSALNKVVKNMSKDWFEEGKRRLQSVEKSALTCREIVLKNKLCFMILCLKKITVCAELLV